MTFAVNISLSLTEPVKCVSVPVLQQAPDGLSVADFRTLANGGGYRGRLKIMENLVE